MMQESCSCVPRADGTSATSIASQHSMWPHATLHRFCRAFLAVTCALLLPPAVRGDAEASAELMGTQVLAVATAAELIDAFLSGTPHILITEHIEFPQVEDGTGPTLFTRSGGFSAGSVRVRASPERASQENQTREGIAITPLLQFVQRRHAIRNHTTAGPQLLTAHAFDLCTSWKITPNVCSFPSTMHAGKLHRPTACHHQRPTTGHAQCRPVRHHHHQPVGCQHGIHILDGQPALPACWAAAAAGAARESFP